jgi:hypothetical protein
MKKQFATVQPQSHPRKPGTPMELKYCERCGNLWLRRSGAEDAHCAPCAGAEAAIASGRFLQLWSRFRAEVQA